MWKRFAPSLSYVPARADDPSSFGALGARLDELNRRARELLARTGGRRATDTIQIVPAPVVEGDREVLHFLVSGIRHVDPDGSRVAQLECGVTLQIRAEPDKDWDPRALLLDVRSGEPVGYVPRYLLGYVHKRREERADLRVTVEQVNGPDVPWHLRLLCRMDVTPTHEHVETAAASQR